MDEEKELIGSCLQMEIDENEIAYEHIVYELLKRVFDIGLSLCAVILCSWLLLLIAFIVRISSKGPALYKDKRVGKDGKTIYVYKFRTMYIDAEERIREYLTEDQMKEWLVERKVKGDPRVTAVGAFLRKSSLDELPQMLNVIGGSISLIGPRPIARFELERNYTEEQQRMLLSCKPGMSGYWAAYGRNSITYQNGERQRMELEYVRNRSLGLDAKLILVTLASLIGVFFKCQK